jgi:hypothetical protein
VDRTHFDLQYCLLGIHSETTHTVSHFRLQHIKNWKKKVTQSFICLRIFNLGSLFRILSEYENSFTSKGTEEVEYLCHQSIGNSDKLM